MQLYNLCLLGMEKVALIYFLKLTFYFQVVFQLVCHLFLQSRFLDERHNVWTIELQEQRLDCRKDQEPHE